MLIGMIKFEYITEPHITYTPCYMQCGFNLQTLIREMSLFVLFFVGGDLKFEYLYIE